MGSLAVLDRDQLTEVTMGDEDLMREVISELVDDTSRQLIALQRAVERSDATECARLAHYSRGACANVGATSLAALMSEVEKKAARRDFPACLDTVRDLSSELEKLRGALASF